MVIDALAMASETSPLLNFQHSSENKGKSIEVHNLASFDPDDKVESRDDLRNKTGTFGREESGREESSSPQPEKGNYIL